MSEKYIALDAIQGASILLVEDNRINQQVAREFLEKGGLKVTLAIHGQEAVELCGARALRSDLDGSPHAGDGWL